MTWSDGTLAVVLLCSFGSIMLVPGCVLLCLCARKDPSRRTRTAGGGGGRRKKNIISTSSTYDGTRWSYIPPIPRPSSFSAPFTMKPGEPPHHLHTTPMHYYQPLSEGNQGRPPPMGPSGSTLSQSGDYAPSAPHAPPTPGTPLGLYTPLGLSGTTGMPPAPLAQCGSPFYHHHHVSGSGSWTNAGEPSPVYQPLDGAPRLNHSFSSVSLGFSQPPVGLQRPKDTYLNGLP